MHLKILFAKWRPFCPGQDEVSMGGYGIFYGSLKFNVRQGYYILTLKSIRGAF